MKKYLKYISFASLAISFISAIMLFNGVILMNTHFVIITVGMVVWFATSPFWKKNKSLEEVE
jgi:hypothetical protein